MRPSPFEQPDFASGGSVNIHLSKEQNRALTCLSRAYDPDDGERAAFRAQASNVTLEQVIDLHRALENTFWAATILRCLEDRFTEWIGDPRLLDLPERTLSQIVRFPEPSDRENFDRVFDFCLQVLDRVGAGASSLFHGVDPAALSRAQMQQLHGRPAFAWQYLIAPMSQSVSSCLRKAVDAQQHSVDNERRIVNLERQPRNSDQFSWKIAASVCLVIFPIVFAYCAFLFRQLHEEIALLKASNRETETMQSKWAELEAINATVIEEFNEFIRQTKERRELKARQQAESEADRKKTQGWEARRQGVE
jgi:hypothetical protein